MEADVRLTFQVLVSLGIILGVVWWVWRLPGSPVTDSASAPYLALGSVWIGLAAVLHNIRLWLDPLAPVVIATGVILYALAITAGYFALWTYRATPPEMMFEPIVLQRQQARMGIGLGLLAVALWYLILLRAAPPAL